MPHLNKVIEGVGEKIKTARLEAKISQRILGKAIGVSETKVYNWENEGYYPSMYELTKVSMYLKKPIEFFLP